MPRGYIEVWGTYLTSHKYILSSEFRANVKIEQGQVQNDQGQSILYLYLSNLVSFYFYLFI